MSAFDLQACIDGDKRAWDAFVERHAPVIYAAVRRVLGPGPLRGEIDDVTQDVFVRLVRRDFHLLRSFDPARASLTTWLTLVARSVAIDAMRKKRTETVPLEGRNAVMATDDPAEESINLPLHLLSPRQRLVLRMLFEEDLSVAEAASVLGVDEQTVRSTKHKAIIRLREHLARPPSPQTCDDLPGERG